LLNSLGVDLRYKPNHKVWCTKFLSIKVQEAKTYLNKLIFSVHDKNVKLYMHVLIIFFSLYKIYHNLFLLRLFVIV
jgi:hypothetical protein